MAKAIKATKKEKESKTKSVLTDAEKASVAQELKYELMFILSPSLTEDKRKKALSEFNELLTANGASVFHVDDWGKRDLAYKIQKQTEGYYMIYYFTLVDTKAIKIFDQHLRLDQAFLRHLIIKRESNHEVKDYTIEEVEVEKPAKPVKKVSAKKVEEKLPKSESNTDKEV